MGSTLGKRLKAAREAAGLSQADVCRMVGIAQPSLFALENDKSKTTRHIAKLAAALGVSPMWLETGKGKQDLSDSDSLQAAINGLPQDAVNLLISVADMMQPRQHSNKLVDELVGIAETLDESALKALIVSAKAMRK